jgi:hypothetical protein
MKETIGSGAIPSPSKPKALNKPQDNRALWTNMTDGRAGGQTFGAVSTELTQLCARVSAGARHK